MAKKTNDILKTMEDDITRIFKENGDFWYQWFIDRDDNALCIYIQFGDWKKDHEYIDYIMGQNCYVKIDEEITREDGSDCYDSIHCYRKKSK